MTAPRRPSCNPSHTYTEEGNFTAILTVTDAQGRTGTANVVVSVGNTQPQVKIEWPVAGGVFAFGDRIAYKVRVDDVEDGSTTTGGIDCSNVVVELILGHDDHGHPMQQQTGCEGSFVFEPDGGHTDTDQITYVLEARYTDRGSPNGQVAPMRGNASPCSSPSASRPSTTIPTARSATRSRPTRSAATRTSAS